MRRVIVTAVALLSMAITTATWANKVLEGNPTEKSTNWDVSDIYSSWDAWQAELENFKAEVPKILEFKGTLGTSAENLLKFFEYTAKNSVMQGKLYWYVELQNDVDGKNPLYRSKHQELQAVGMQYGLNSTWIASELAAIPQATVEQWMKENEKLAVYRHEILDFYRTQERILDEKTQSILTQFGNSFGLASKAYNTLSVVDIDYPTVTLSTGEAVKVSPAAASKVYSSNRNQEDRLAVSRGTHEPFVKNKNTYAELMLGLLQTRWASAKLRNYNSCLEAVLDGNNIPMSVYTNLLKVAKSNNQPLQKYWDLRRRALGLEKYYSSDSYLELLNYEKDYNWIEATDMVKEALKPLGDEYNSLLAKALKGGWIDVYEKPGKQPGAYNLSLYGVHPYILLNWANTRDNVFTLAHELGHGIHGMLHSTYQPYIYSGSASMVAEVASTFNEFMLLDHMLKQAKTSEEKVVLLIQAIDNITQTFYRQVQFADFEYNVYSLVEQDKPVNAEVIANLYADIDKQFNGEGVEQVESAKYAWPRIHHFFNYNYYVYNYAVSFSTSSALYDNIANAPNAKARKEATERYLTLLKSGSNDYPVSLLQKAGVDLTKEDAFLAVTRQMEKLVNQLEVELKKMNKI